MDQRHKELKELHIIQRDFANYVYQNFEIYINDKEKLNKVAQQYKENKELWTEKEYIERIIKTRIYYNIEKVEFTNMSITPMHSLEIQFKINDVYDDYIILNTKLAETDEWIYGLKESNGSGPYHMGKKKQATHEPIPDSKIIYYEKGIN